jgi:lipopolysaccharide export system protein LptA
MLPPLALKGSVSAVFEPVQINFYIDDAPRTMIKAQKAIVDPRRRRMILQKDVQVNSGALNLSTDRLVIYPETGLFEIEKNYVLKTQDKTITGENLTTDFFLQKVSM